MQNKHIGSFYAFGPPYLAYDQNLVTSWICVLLAMGFFATAPIQIAPKFDHKLDLGSFGMALIQIAPKFGHKLDLGPFGDNPCPTYDWNLIT